MDIVEFIRNSTVTDFLVIFVTIVLILFALIALIFARNKKVFLAVIASAAIPLVAGLLSTFLKYQQLERALSLAGTVSAEIVESARAEAWMISYIGVVGAIIIGVLGLIGVIAKGRAA